MEDPWVALRNMGFSELSDPDGLMSCSQLLSDPQMGWDGKGAPRVSEAALGIPLCSPREVFVGVRLTHKLSLC